MTSFKLRQLSSSDNEIVDDMELNRVLYKATLLLALPLSRTYLLLVLGFSKVMYTTEGMLLLNGEIANSFNQRNVSCIFVDIETNVDSSNTLMTTSDAVKLVIRGKLLAWIKYYMYLVPDQRRINGSKSNFRNACMAPLVLEMAPLSQSHTAISV